MKEKLLALLAKLGLTVDVTKLSEDDIKVLEGAVVVPPPPTNPSDPNIKAMIEAALAPVIAKNEQLQKLLGDEAIARQAATDAIKADNDRKRADEIKTLLDAAVAAGKIPADNTQKRADWQKQFESNFDTAKFALGEIPGVKTGDNQKKTGDKTPRGVDPKVEISTLREDAAAAFASV